MNVLFYANFISFLAFASGEQDKFDSSSPKLENSIGLSSPSDFFKKFYPKYESTSTKEQQIEVTPEELENLPLKQMYLDVEAEEEDDPSWFVDEEEFENAPMIRVLSENKKLKYRMIVLQHERYYRENAARLYVPRLKETTRLTKDEFKEHFFLKSQPVIIPFEAMRHLNFTTKAYSMEELLELYPNHKEAVYKYGAHLKSEEIDLGPALAILSEDKDLVKTKKGRNYPRNLKVDIESISLLDIQYPPITVEDTKMMAPSVWFGATSSSTATHSDCCDNFAMMITGTKRWTIAPPSESRIIKPKCQGSLCWAKRIPHADEHASTPQMKKLRDQTQLIDFDLKAGELLYLPCGWFHHVENKGPTVMVNFWTKEKPYFLQYVDGDLE